MASNFDRTFDDQLLPKNNGRKYPFLSLFLHIKPYLQGHARLIERKPIWRLSHTKR